MDKVASDFVQNTFVESIKRALVELFQERPSEKRCTSIIKLIENIASLNENASALLKMNLEAYDGDPDLIDLTEQQLRDLCDGLMVAVAITQQNVESNVVVPTQWSSATK